LGELSLSSGREERPACRNVSVGGGEDMERKVQVRDSNKYRASFGTVNL